ncbi:hypothetical protein D0A37_19525 [Microcoleus vaginatus HSN003]|nr:hypothetical protein D0A37_19525 [Microcoleus vaginatus HSN003]
MNKASVRDLIWQDKRKDLKDWCENTCKRSLNQMIIRDTLKNSDTTSDVKKIYDIFLEIVHKILLPQDPHEQFKYKRSISESISKIFREHYSLTDIQKPIIDSSKFLGEEVYKYLDYVTDVDKFFKHLWQCLKDYKYDDEIIGIAWVAASELVSVG